MDLGAAFIPQRQVGAAPFQGTRDWGGLPNRPRLERDGIPHALEGIGGQLLRDQPDLRSRRTIVANDVVAVRQDGSLRRGLTIPQMMLMSVVLPAPLGPRRAKISALADLEVDILERVQARSVGPGEIGNADDGLHELLLPTLRAEWIEIDAG